MSGALGEFTEKDFYLAEFRRRSIGIALPGDAPGDLAPLDSVLAVLVANDTRVVVFAPSEATLARVTPHVIRRAAESAWAGRLWRLLAKHRLAGVLLGDERFAACCRDAATELQLAKLVWIDPQGTLCDAEGRRISSLALPDLDRRVAEVAGSGGTSPVPLAEFRAMLAGGVTSVSSCPLTGLADELFTYAGSGTFFTRERYTDVRRLTLDDFDAAASLLSQGVAEGYLAPRSEAEVDELLSHGFGVFIEGRYLAGVGSLRPYPGTGTGEIAGLYTVTRFAGEGVGGHLIRFALGCAREAGLARVFACTTSERVARFFVRNGFEPRAAADLPAEKWRGYPEERKKLLQCFGKSVG
jgi:amino-acid N-acetyltransferase